MKDEKIYSVPASPVANTVYKIMAAGKDLSLLKERNKNNIILFTTECDGKKAEQIIIENEENNTQLFIYEFDKFTKANKTVKKIFLFLLSKVSEQAFSNHELHQAFIEFHVKELVRIGCYKHIESARRGFIEAMNVIHSLHVGGQFSLNQKKITTTTAVPFYQSKIDNNICTVGLADYFDWEILFAFYTYVPEYFFSASNKTIDTIIYLMYLCRQRKKEISNQGGFNITIKSIIERLNLPDYKKTKNPKKDIKDVLCKTVKEINEISDGTIKIAIDREYKKTTDFIEEGIAYIEIKGKLKEKFKKIGSKKIIKS